VRTQLICTFTRKPVLYKTIETILIHFDIIYDKIFILSTNDSNELICSYNIDRDNTNSFLPQSISVHRKKETNTLYTINALNEIVKTLNNGVLDSSVDVPWINYRDSLLVTDQDNQLKQINTKIFSVQHIKK
jgi:hypothetical protein